MSVLRDSRRVLKYVTSVVALLCNYLGNTSLTDYRISVTTNAGIHKQLVYVLKTYCASVYKIFALSRAVITSCNRYLVIRAVKATYCVGIVKRNGNLGISHRTTGICSAENDILHL